jgi:hypothetical protein
MVPLIIVMIILIVGSISLTILYFKELSLLIINLPILWMILIRSYFEIAKKRYLQRYLISLVITTIIFSTLFNYIQIKILFWPVWFLTIIFLLTQLANVYITIDNKYKIKKKIKIFLEKFSFFKSHKR